MIPLHARNLALVLAAAVGVFLIVDGVLALLGLGPSVLAMGIAALCGFGGGIAAQRLLREPKDPDA